MPFSDRDLVAHIAKLPHSRGTFKQLVRELAPKGASKDWIDKALDRLTATGELIETRNSQYAVSAQSREYQQSVLPGDISARVSIEAGATFGWHRWVGDRGVALGLDRFGASAPYETIYKELGLTADNIVKTVQGLLK